MGAPGAARPPLAELIGRLRDAGADLDAEGFADALWLAQWIPPPPVGAGGAQNAGSPEPGGGPSDRSHQAKFPGPVAATRVGAPYLEGPRSEPEHPSPPGHRAVDLLPTRAHAGRESGPGKWLGQVGAPTATALPELLSVQRALRPIQRYQPQVTPARSELDEAATADRAARAGLLLPVMRGVRRHEAELRLLIDGSAVSIVWGQLLRELREVCERVGAFRNVRVGYLKPRGSGVGVADGSGLAEPLRPAEQLYDPTGRQLSLVVSDCTGPLWQSGAMQRLLHRHARRAPIAVVQPLPQRLWRRTFLPADGGLLTRRPGGYGVLGFFPQSRRPRPVPPGAVPVPVLYPEPAAFRAWARLVAGSVGLTVRCAAAWVSADQPRLPPQPRPADGDPTEQLRAFEHWASPAARQLVLQLSAAPLALPVMQLVQRAMLPDTGPAELAEVLISGLMRPVDGPMGEGSAAEPWYDFAPGIRELLLDRLSAGEATLVLKHCSLYVERRYGRTARNFPAVAVAYLAGTRREPVTGTGDVVPEPFARVADTVLRRFEPSLDLPLPGSPGPPAEAGADPAADGRRRLERYERDGSSRDLLEAVRLLRASAASADVDVRLAQAMLYHWREWRDPRVLDEAEQAAQNAVTAADAETPSGRGLAASVMLARVLTERARTRLDTGRWHAALADLLRATDQCRGALRRGTGPPEVLLDCALLHVDALRMQYDIVGRLNYPVGDEDRGVLLAEAEDSLNRLLPLWRPADLPGPLLLRRGRIRLDRARAVGSRGGEVEQQTLALQAVADLESGVRRLAEAGGSPAQICVGLLECAEGLCLDPAGRNLAKAWQTLDAARAIARDQRDGPLEAECLRRIAEVCRARYSQTGDAAQLDLADDALARGVGLVPADSPDHAELLAARGEVLLDRAAAQPAGDGHAVQAAVHALRGAVAESAGSPGAAARKLLFGRALALRYARQGHLADLHEAAWILDQAEREATDPATSAHASLELGDVRVSLSGRYQTHEQLDLATAAYRRSAAEALRCGQRLLAARAHSRRGKVLEVTGGAAAAVMAYRQSMEQWQLAGSGNSEEALRTRERIRALDTAS